MRNGLRIIAEGLGLMLFILFVARAHETLAFWLLDEKDVDLHLPAQATQTCPLGGHQLWIGSQR